MSIVKKGVKDIAHNIDEAMTDIFGFEADENTRAIWQANVTIRPHTEITMSTDKVTDTELTITIMKNTTQDFSEGSQPTTE